MTDNSIPPSRNNGSIEPVQRILDLVEPALRLSDLAGYTFVAIDLSSARDKLMAISRDEPSAGRPYQPTNGNA